MSAATKAAIAPPKTPQRVGESAARASQAFELHAAADYQQPPLRATGRRARGAMAIDVPRTMAATPRGWWLATTVVERGTGSGIGPCPAPTERQSA
jgi:hypothetical protein